MLLLLALAVSASATCVRPSKTQGYDILSETNLTGTGFNVTVQCAPGYGGELPAALACAQQGEPYQLKNCLGTRLCLCLCLSLFLAFVL